MQESEPVKNESEEQRIVCLADTKASIRKCQNWKWSRKKKQYKWKQEWEWAQNESKEERSIMVEKMALQSLMTTNCTVKPVPTYKCCKQCKCY